jgi:hypothetical protein
LIFIGRPERHSSAADAVLPSDTGTLAVSLETWPLQ